MILKNQYIMHGKKYHPLTDIHYHIYCMYYGVGHAKLNVSDVQYFYIVLYSPSLINSFVPYNVKHDEKFSRLRAVVDEVSL